MTTPPRLLGDETEHYWLAQSMAKAVGVDLAKAQTEGHLTQDDWAGMVQRCRGCDWTEGCKKWLSVAAWGQETAPATCENHTRFASLAE